MHTVFAVMIWLAASLVVSVVSSAAMWFTIFDQFQWSREAKIKLWLIFWVPFSLWVMSPLLESL